MSSLPNWEAMMGYQCANLLLNNRDSIKKCLPILPNNLARDNAFFQRETKRHPSCSVDYLVHTKTNSLYLCEFTFSEQRVEDHIIPHVQQKVGALTKPKRFSVFPVLIHVNGVEDSVIESKYFTEIIDFSKILSKER